MAFLIGLPISKIFFISFSNIESKSLKFGATYDFVPAIDTCPVRNDPIERASSRAIAELMETKISLFGTNLFF